MNEKLAVYDSLAALLDYPHDDFKERVEQCCSRLKYQTLEAAHCLTALRERAFEIPLENIEEHYVQTFDMNKACALELGWQLFGEDYKRGVFLVKMRRELNRLQVPENSELPDHLSHALMALGRMEAREGETFANACLLPAVNSILNALGPDQFYAHLIEAIVKWVESQHLQPMENYDNDYAHSNL